MIVSKERTRPGIVGLQSLWSAAAQAPRETNLDRAEQANPPVGVDLTQVTLEARIALEEAIAAATVAAQRAIGYAEVLDEALAVLEEIERTAASAPPPPAALPRPVRSLSPRERDVLALVAEGRSNKAIAATLFVSPNTVKTHVTSLLTKLQVGSRVQLAALAVRQGIGAA